jgi:hypothetical protein
MWPLDAWDFDKEKLINRVSLINKLSNSVPNFKKHTFSIARENITLHTNWVGRRAPDAASFGKPLDQLALSLDAISERGLVHGDINLKNVIWDGCNWIVIDWEPILEYTYKNTKVLMATKPYIYSGDIKTFELTNKTDKIGFFFFIKKSMAGWYKVSASEVNQVENNLIGLSFRSIVENIRESGSVR